MSSVVGGNAGAPVGGLIGRAVVELVRAEIAYREQLLALARDVAVWKPYA